MKKGSTYFGETATGATSTLMLNDTTMGQDYPAAGSNYVAFMDYKSGQCSANGLPAVSVKNMTSLALTVLPDNLPALPATDPYQYLDEWCSNYLPSVNGNWVTWMTDDKPSDPNDLTNSTWYFQLLAFDMSRPSTLPVAVTWQNADAWYPCVDGNYVVWEDYRNDPDGKPDANNFMNDNSDIYLADLTSVDSKTHQPKVYPICTAPGPQLAPRISGHYVIWEDWRNGVNGEIYCYDLNEDTGNTGTPNWKRSGSARPSPDPAEYQPTNQPIPASNSWPAFPSCRMDRPTMRSGYLDNVPKHRGEHLDDQLDRSRHTAGNS